MKFYPWSLAMALVSLFPFVAQATEIHCLDTGIANVYLLKGKKSFLIDTSSHGHEKEIEAWLQKQGTPLKSLEAIILTHGHGDHAGGAMELGKKQGVPVWVGAQDHGMLKQGKSRPLLATSFIAGLLGIFVDSPYPAYTADREISSAVDLAPYGINGQIIPLPGHTQGSLALILNDSHSAIVGDLIRGGVFQTEEPRLHFFHEARPQTQWQLWQLLKHQKIQTFYPGHFGPLNREAIEKSFFPTGLFNWLMPITEGERQGFPSYSNL